MSAVMVYVSHAYKNMEMAREHISLILELVVMLLSFQMTFSLVTAAVVWAILDSITGLDPSCVTVATYDLLASNNRRPIRLVHTLSLSMSSVTKVTRLIMIYLSQITERAHSLFRRYY